MENDITILAGANNSGKTSFVELLGCVFGKSNGKFSADDFSAIECQKWKEAIYPQIEIILKYADDKERIITEICNLIYDIETGPNIFLPPIEVKIQVDYNEENDDIRNFADFIMEFAPKNTSFYFIYKFEFNHDVFRKNLDNIFEKLSVRFKKLVSDADKNKDIIRIIGDMLIKLYADSSEEKAFFSDSNYKNAVGMEISTFKNLFNYQNIMARRILDDENADRTHTLSKNMIDIASKEDGWKDLVSNLPDQIIQPIQDAGIQDKVRTASLNDLDHTIKEISKTNGGHAESILLDMNITDESIQSLLKNITRVKYQADGQFLSESSQGLGYSNLIFIHLQLEKFKKTVNPLVVNFFVIEELEAHMHPKMQRVFSKYIFDYYKQENNVQGLLTTHSHEVVRNAKILNLRVLKQINYFECKIYDLKEFQESIKKKSY